MKKLVTVGLSNGLSSGIRLASSLKKSLSKLNKTGAIKNMIKCQQKPLGFGGIKGLHKPKEERDNTPKKLAPIPGMAPQIHQMGPGGIFRPPQMLQNNLNRELNCVIPRNGYGSDLEVEE